MAWKFHFDVWDGVTVTVMPKTRIFRVKDSNVGIVMACLHLGRQVDYQTYEHPENLRRSENGVVVCAVCGIVPSSVITRDGERPDCDLLALSRVLGDRHKAERILSV